MGFSRCGLRPGKLLERHYQGSFVVFIMDGRHLIKEDVEAGQKNDTASD